MDQAQTLRKMMKGLEGRLILDTAQIPVISMVFAREDVSNRKTQTAFLHLLGSKGVKALNVSDEFSHNGIRRESNTLWSVTPGSLKQNPLDEWDLSDRGVKVVLIDGQTGIDEERLCLYATTHRTVVILTTEEADLVSSYQIIKSLTKRVGVKKIDVLVMGTNEAREGVRVFTKLHEFCCRFLDAELAYLGCFLNFAQNEEKNQDRRFHPKFLLDYKSRSALLADLEVVAKRLGLIPAQ